jgi:hypothetical protein
MANKKKQSSESGDVLIDTARVIGTALGTMSAQADALTAQAKKIHLPSKEEAKKFVSRMLSRKKEVAASKAAAKKKSAAPAKKKKSVAKKSARKK